MPEPNFEAAKQYALMRLERDLSPALVYHSLAHTRDDVVPAADQFAQLARVSGEDLLRLRTAAYFHDIGFVEQREDHEMAGVRIVGQVLPEFGYSDGQVASVGDLLRATRLPQSPRNLIEEILADADLDVLGRDDYWPRNEALRREWAAFGLVMTDREWHDNQLTFLSGHEYFTAVARRLRGPKKQVNIERLRLLLS